jgi:uncharacterized protein Yka (UPF0111/DUF47 family)
MEIPEEFLPLKIYGTGRITGKSLSQYAVKAANNLPKAIELLELSLERLETNNIEKSEQEFIDQINTFLNTLKNDK